MLANLAYVGILFAHAMNEYGDWWMALWKVMVFSGISLGCVVFLEFIEYIEHYGLIYRDDKDEDQITELCSWNPEVDVVTNLLLFRSHRHSDHHMNAYKIYTTLEMNDKMPVFPFSFFDGSVFCIIPQLWYFIMDPYVDEAVEGKKVDKRHDKLIKRMTDWMNYLLTAFVLCLALDAYCSK